MTIAHPVTVKPTPQRRQHGRIERAERVQDSAGNAGLPWLSLSLLVQWERAGTITPQMRDAGDRFHATFQRAGLDPLRAADMGRIGGGSGGEHIGHGSEEARRTIAAALDTLGEPAGSCCWYVLGCEKSMREWAMRIEGKERRPIREEVAKGILKGALGVLVKYFGI